MCSARKERKVWSSSGALIIFQRWLVISYKINLDKWDKFTNSDRVVNLITLLLVELLSRDNYG